VRHGGREVKTVLESSRDEVAPYTIRLSAATGTASRTFQHRGNDHLRRSEAVSLGPDERVGGAACWYSRCYPEYAVSEAGLTEVVIPAQRWWSLRPRRRRSRFLHRSVRAIDEHKIEAGCHDLLHALVRQQHLDGAETDRQCEDAVGQRLLRRFIESTDPGAKTVRVDPLQLGNGGLHGLWRKD